MELSKVEIIISLSKFEDLRHELSKLNLSGVTVYQAIGCGTQKGTKEYEISENVEIQFLPKQVVMLVVENKNLDRIIDAIEKALYTGHIGDGKIIVTPVSNIIRVRTGEDGVDALN